jgi:exodeoxyribonuclease V gamma subunit
MSFTIHTGNRTELLLDALAGVLAADPLRDPFAPETILVQSRDMERWMVKELAGRLGVFANARFPFPNAFVNEIFRIVLPGGPPDDPFSRERMVWQLFRHLPHAGTLPGGEILSGYLSDDPDGRKRIQLADKIADSLDRAILYRPELVLSWETRAEDDGDWLGGLWKRLVAGSGRNHRAALRARFFEAIERGLPEGIRLPARISVFGIPAMPPFHFEVLERLSTILDLHLFLLNPSREYWGDIKSHREQIRIRRLKGNRDLDPEHDLHLGTGNALLASLGRQGRHLHRLSVAAAEDMVERFEAPAADTLLSRIQADIYALQDRGAPAGPGKVAVDAADESLRIHACHSRMREIEVLYDRLLDRFAADPALTPGDVVVMAPDIDAYAPCVEAVFGREAEGGAEGAAPRIPFSVANTGVLADSGYLRAFLAILELRGGRFPASGILALCDAEPVRRRFGFTPGEIDRVSGWVGDAGVRWGIDAADRARHGLPAFPDFSWQEGMSRILLSVAMSPEATPAPFRGLLPTARIDGAGALLAGRFAEFVETLFARLRELDAERTPKEWAATLASLTDALLEGDGDDPEALKLRKTLEAMAAFAEEAGVTDPVPFDVVRHWIARQAEGGGGRSDSRFLAGGVTFCKLLPMRSIPFKVVALVGMNGGDFPRQEQVPGFDPVAADPKGGDRSLRDEDRYLFLESLLSARVNLIVTYVGRNAQSDEEVPPSVVVSELLDYAGQAFTPPDGFESMREWLVVDHPLQPFSPAAFGEGRKGDAPSRRFSYSAENLAGFHALEHARADAAEPKPHEGVFLRYPLAPPEGEPVHVELASLLRFLKHPVRHFLQSRLGISLPEKAIVPSDDEPFRLDGLQSFDALRRLVDARASGADPDSGCRSLKAAALLPPGHFGAEEAARLSRDAEGYLRALAPHLASPALPPLRVRIALGGVVLAGQLSGVRENGLVRWRPSGVKPKDRLSLRVEQLVLLHEIATRGDVGGAARSVHIGIDRKKGKAAVFECPPVADPAAELSRILELYRAGMCEPLPFFEKSSCAFAETYFRQRARLPEAEAERLAIHAALKEWRSDPFSDRPMEEEDPWNRLAFGKAKPHPFGERFREIALSLFGPLLDAGGRPADDSGEAAP